MAQIINVRIVPGQVLELLPGLDPLPVLLSLLLLLDLVLLRAVVEQLLVHFHEQFKRIVDQAVNSFVPEEKKISCWR